MENKYVIGLDIGTTSTKAVLFKLNGSVVAESEGYYPVYHPYLSWVEQNPDEIEKAAITAIQGVIQKSGIPSQDILSVGISSAMHSLICVNEAGNALSPSITWADGRSVKQAIELKESFGRSVYLKTGTPIHPMSPLVKLIWMKENHYEAYHHASRFISIKEYLIKKWFNQYVVDYSVAAATGLFNIHTFDWEEQALEIAGIRRDQLSDPVPPTYICKGLNKEVANKMKLNIETPFVIGASDGPLANLGIGAINPGDVAITIGTSGAIRQMSSNPQTDDLQEIFCYSLTKNLWVMGGPTNNGAIVLQWIKDILGDHEKVSSEGEGINPYDLLTNFASTVNPGSNGLLFLPYLSGERAPHWDANARGSFIGLTLSHKKEHLIRSCLEGVIYSLYNVGEALERLAGQPKKILASGGFARSTLWVQILADIFGQDIYIPESHQSSAWGAAWVSLVGIGYASSFDEIKNYIPMKETFHPHLYNHEIYKTLYQTYKELYAVLKPHFWKLAEIQRIQ